MILLLLPPTRDTIACAAPITTDLLTQRILPARARRRRGMQRASAHFFTGFIAGSGNLR